MLVDASRTSLDRSDPLLDLFVGLRDHRPLPVPEEGDGPVPGAAPGAADRFRGMFGFDEERCIDCHALRKACPIDIIHIEVHDEEPRSTARRRR